LRAALPQLVEAPRLEVLGAGGAARQDWEVGEDLERAEAPPDRPAEARQGQEGRSTGTQPGSVPAGYPTPTADKYAVCASAAMSGSLCPGGGAGPVCIACHFGGAAGDYAVTVTLGGAAAKPNLCECGGKPGPLGPGDHQSRPIPDVRFFGRRPERRRVSRRRAVSAGTARAGHVLLRPDGNSPSGQRHWICAGHRGHETCPWCLLPVILLRATNPVLALAAGDRCCLSIFAPPVDVANYADSGEAHRRSTEAPCCGVPSSRTGARATGCSSNSGITTRAFADATVQTNLEKYVTDAQAANVNAILISPPSRVSSIPVGDQSSLHAVSAQGAATAKGVPFIDLTALSTAWYNGLGMTKTEVLAAYHAGGNRRDAHQHPGR